MRKKPIRKIFIVVLIYLLLQYAAVGIIGYIYSEPWPAFVFPGFKNVYVYDDGFEIVRTTFELHYINNEIKPTVVTPSQLFPEIPNSQLAGFLRVHFDGEAKSNDITPAGLDWLEKQARRAAVTDVESLVFIRTREYWQNHAGGMRIDSAFVISKNQIRFSDSDDE